MTSGPGPWGLPLFPREVQEWKKVNPVCWAPTRLLPDGQKARWGSDTPKATQLGVQREDWTTHCS